MRTRKNAIKIMLSDDEYKRFILNLKASGLRQREFILYHLDKGIVPTVEYLECMSQVCEEIYHNTEQIKRIGVNVNQLARVANATGALPEYAELESIRALLLDTRKEAEKIWQSTKSLTASGA
ncbi:MAG: plasmid mobilization relaxosome protein MobC [Clostridia bacterium]|nr:plasmid mobilization relaxosome protein MobC [Clostridia bacterium]